MTEITGILSLVDRAADKVKPPAYGLSAADRAKLLAGGAMAIVSPPAGAHAPVKDAPKHKPTPARAKHIPEMSPEMKAAVAEILAIDNPPPVAAYYDGAKKHGVEVQSLRNAVTRARNRKKSSAASVERYVVKAKDVAARYPDSPAIIDAAELTTLRRRLAAANTAKEHALSSRDAMRTECAQLRAIIRKISKLIETPVAE